MPKLAVRQLTGSGSASESKYPLTLMHQDLLTRTWVRTAESAQIRSRIETNSALEHISQKTEAGATMKYLIYGTLLVIVFFHSIAHADGDSSSAQTLTSIEIEQGSKQKKIDKLDEEIQRIEEAINFIKSLSASFASKKNQNRADDNEIQKLKSEYKRLSESDEKSAVAIASAVQQSLENLGITVSFFGETGDSTFSIDIPNSLKESFMSSAFNTPETQQPADTIDQLYKCAFRMVNNRAIKVLKEEKCSKAISSLSSEAFDSHFDREKQKNIQRANKIEESLAAMKSQRLIERSKIIQEKGDLNAKRESILAKKSETDKTLTYAILIMIAVLLLMFISLRFFSADVQYKIIESRTLVEVVGIAFLLLTVIILGTGEKVDKSSLGTLLGSIAGYIFGQQIGSRRTANKSSDGENTTSPTPG